MSNMNDSDLITEEELYAAREKALSHDKAKKASAPPKEKQSSKKARKRRKDPMHIRRKKHLDTLLLVIVVVLLLAFFSHLGDSLFGLISLSAFIGSINFWILLVIAIVIGAVVYVINFFR